MATKSAKENATTEPDRNKTSGSVHRGRHKVDWEAVERDFRTGHFTLRELEAKHGVSYAQISRKSKREAWSKDLRDVIKQATDAALLRETVTNAQKDVTETVIVAAELNKSVILGHRGDLKSTRDVAVGLLDELAKSSLLAEDQDLLSEVLAGEDAEPVDKARARATVQKALSVHQRIASVKQLADAFDKLQVAERRAFSLDEKGDDSGPSLTDIATEELRRMRARLLNED
ncbi:MAG: hypothetical protein LBE61_09610 [Burkholderiaceae bacterium]|jgi:hypothetical protein|nr:hypothetical protein [Burkholderiaceae bacterium]